MHIDEFLLLTTLVSLAMLVACPLVTLHARRRMHRERRWATEVAEDLVVLMRKGWLDRARSRLQESPGILGEHFRRVGLWPGETGYYASEESLTELKRVAQESLASHDHLLTCGLAFSIAGVLALVVVVGRQGEILAGTLATVLMILCTPVALVGLNPLVAWLCRRGVRLWTAELCLHLRRLQQEVVASVSPLVPG